MVATRLFAFGSKPVCRRMALRPNPSLALQAFLTSCSDRESASSLLKFQLSPATGCAGSYLKETSVEGRSGGLQAAVRAKGSEK